MIWCILVPFIWVASAICKALLLVPSALGVLCSVAGDGWKRTPRMWKWAADAEATPKVYESRFLWWTLKFTNNRIGVWWFWAIRNPVKCMVIDQPPSYFQAGDIDESKPGLQFRWRRYKGLASFRVAWGEPMLVEGKKEFYIGWKLGSTSPCKFTVQLRPF